MQPGVGLDQDQQCKITYKTIEWLTGRLKRMNLMFSVRHMTNILQGLHCSQVNMGTPLFGLYEDVPPDRVWLFGLAVLLKQGHNFTCLCP